MPRKSLFVLPAEFRAGDTDAPERWVSFAVASVIEPSKMYLASCECLGRALAAAESRGVEMFLADHAVVQARAFDDAKTAALHQCGLEHVGAARAS